MDKTWVDLDRSSDEYRHKLKLFLDEAFAKSIREDKILCPCKKCCNRYLNDKKTVEGHLLWHGMDLLYRTARWTHHGEPYTNEEESMPYDNHVGTAKSNKFRILIFFFFNLFTVIWQYLEIKTVSTL